MEALLYLVSTYCVLVLLGTICRSDSATKGLRGSRGAGRSTGKQSTLILEEGIVVHFLSQKKGEGLARWVSP